MRQLVKIDVVAEKLSVSVETVKELVRDRSCSLVGGRKRHFPVERERVSFCEVFRHPTDVVCQNSPLRGSQSVPARSLLSNR